MKPRPPRVRGVLPKKENGKTKQTASQVGLAGVQRSQLTQLRSDGTVEHGIFERWSALSLDPFERGRWWLCLHRRLTSFAESPCETPQTLAVSFRLIPWNQLTSSAPMKKHNHQNTSCVKYDIGERVGTVLLGFHESNLARRLRSKRGSGDGVADRKMSDTCCRGTRTCLQMIYRLAINLSSHATRICIPIGTDQI